MLLSELGNIINIKKTYNIKKNKIFNNLKTSSKDLNNKSIFIIKKKKFKEKYLIEGINKKIPAIISNKYYSKFSNTQFIVKNIDTEKQKLLNYLKPNKPINSIAITGTNGKSSVAWFISEICRINNINSKMQGTLGYYVNGIKNKNERLTTPSFEILWQNSFSKQKNKFNYIFEASSHALYQNRIKNFPINIAAITNISQDHLDYHKSLKNYKEAKFKLFKIFLDSKGTAIINSRIKYKKELISLLRKRKINFLIYGSSEINIKRINKKNILKIYNKKYNLKNIEFSEIDKENLECAISCCLKLKIKPQLIAKSLNHISFPPGRSEIIFFKKKSSKVIIDYAHTPDALKKILIAYTDRNKKPNLVFGCGGNRDRDKRKKMGRIAFKYAKNIIITDDNPRNEDPKSIRSQILKYCPNAIEKPGRKNAIVEAINDLKKKHILIIAGKGHEKIQILKNKTVPFDDVKVVKKIIKKFK